jgi:UDP-glucose-4-epimerase GalE
MTRPRALVTGGAGYIGSHTVKALRRSGRDVVVLDDLSAGHREAVGDAPLIVADVRDGAAVRAALRESRADSVLHFAGRLNVAESVGDPAGYYDVNVVGALTLLEAMASEGVERLVFSSTCAVYGEPEATPITESHPTRPINPYGETKLAVERALPHFERACGLRSIALRYFNASGADPDGELGEDHDPEIHVIPRAIESALEGVPFQIFGRDYPTPDGACLRDYVHVTDLADAHVRALQALEDGSGSAVFNVGTGRPHSVLEVVGAVERVCGRPVNAIDAPRRAGDPARLYAANDRVRDVLGWRPRFTDLDDIVRTAWAWRVARPRGYCDQSTRTC